MRVTVKAVGLALLLVGCGRRLDMQRHYGELRANLVSGNYVSADAHIKRQKEGFYGEDNRVLYYMNRGIVLSLAKKYEESNRFLEQAEKAAQALWTESIRDVVGAGLATDNSLPYQGEDFEKVAINIVSALNYIGLGDFDAARVEARQVTNQLELFRKRYAEDNEGAVTRYADDAFARWLSGKMRSLEGSFEGYNEAWIEYRKSLKMYETDYAKRYGLSIPKFVVRDALFALENLGEQFQSEFKQIRTRYPNVKYTSMDEGHGEVVLIHLNGEAPYKVDKYWDAVAVGEPFRIAFPEFVTRPPQIVGSRISANGRKVKSELGEPWAKIAVTNLEDHMARIKTRAIARAVAKYIAAKGLQAAGKKTDDAGASLALTLAGAIFQVGNYVAEEADKRSWVTLPAGIFVSSLALPVGEVTLKAEFLDRGGRVLENKTFNVQVAAGRSTFIVHRTFR